MESIYDNLIKELNLKTEEVPLLTGELVNADQKDACASMNTSIDELPGTAHEWQSWRRSFYQFAPLLFQNP
jgi:hypothetical protein